mmetsp:Transcript_14528/g.29037  ORF Transcript_14528/g.29037 Transcript_14528/m.29037 type:complete len:354 (+) Transcript_14528:247-1308(+)
MARFDAMKILAVFFISLVVVQGLEMEPRWEEFDWEDLSLDDDLDAPVELEGDGGSQWSWHDVVQDYLPAGSYGGADHPDELLASHKELHLAAVKHAAHRKAQQLTNGRPIKLPVIPRQPPVCSAPPPMRFCKAVVYPVYRPSAQQTFAQLDFDSHAVFKKIVPHMRISERHFELPVIQRCRNNFRQFLCLRNFPRCCHVGLCNKYGAPEPVLSTASLKPLDAQRKQQKATTVTFVNGSRDTMKVQQGRNDTVKVKVADATCLQYVKTYTPLFDCRTECSRLLSSDCLFMLSQDCDNLCYGVHSEQCATKSLYQIATGKDSAGPAVRPGAIWASMGVAVLALWVPLVQVAAARA